MTAPWLQLALVAVGTAVLLAVAVAWLIRASREGDAGFVSRGWLSEARRREDAQEGRPPQ